MTTQANVASSLRLAFDIGGTFTDFVLERVSNGVGSYVSHKKLTTHHNLTEGTLEGAAAALATMGVAFSDLDEVLHATTVATNTLLERTGARTGLLTTRGFRDVLLLGRQKRYELYDLAQAKPTPLVPRSLIAGLPERLDADGKVLRELTPESIDESLMELEVGGALEALAVVLLHSYANPVHEEMIKRRLEASRPGLPISLSKDVAPRRGEFERTSTTVVDAYIKPMVRSYLSSLQQGFRDRGFGGRIHIMQSNGGLASVEIASEQPVRIVESGPAAGVLMGGDLVQKDLCDALTLDMGGTTTKVGLIIAGRPSIRDTFEVGGSGRAGSGLALDVPSVDLLEIGAGGGSIAFARAGTIGLGPHSAGSEPGPACYGLGGSEPTLTDANLLLGYLNPSNFANGLIRLNQEAAEVAIETKVARPLGISILEAAWGIHAVATASMERALRIMSVERGHDPRTFRLIAFGGAGPMHAARLARALSIPEVLVPRGAGVGSALGLLGADARFDVSRTRNEVVDDAIGARLTRAFAELREACTRQFGLSGTMSWEHAIAMRYVGQGQQVQVDLPETPEELASAPVFQLFENAYRRLYGYTQAGAQAEVVNWRVTSVRSNSNQVLRFEAAERLGAPTAFANRKAFFTEAGGLITCPTVNGDELQPGDVIVGPAIVASRDCTTVLLPADRLVLDPDGTSRVQIKVGL